MLIATASRLALVDERPAVLLLVSLHELLLHVGLGALAIGLPRFDARGKLLDWHELELSEIVLVAWRNRATCRLFELEWVLGVVCPIVDRAFVVDSSRGGGIRGGSFVLLYVDWLGILLQKRMVKLIGRALLVFLTFVSHCKQNVLSRFSAIS